MSEDFNKDEPVPLEPKKEIVHPIWCFGTSVVLSLLMILCLFCSAAWGWLLFFSVSAGLFLLLTLYMVFSPTYRECYSEFVSSTEYWRSWNNNRYYYLDRTHEDWRTRQETRIDALITERLSLRKEVLALEARLHTAVTENVVMSLAKNSQPDTQAILEKFSEKT